MRLKGVEPNLSLSPAVDAQEKQERNQQGKSGLNFSLWNEVVALHLQCSIKIQEFFYNLVGREVCGDFHCARYV